MPSKIKKRGENTYLLSVAAGYEANGKQKVHTKTITANSEREVQKQYALFVAEVERGEVSTSGNMTLAQFYDYWTSNYAIMIKKHAATTLAYNDHLFTRIRSSLGHKKLNKIEPKHLLDFYKNLAEPGIKKIQIKKGSTEKKPPEKLSSNTIKKHHTLLCTMLNVAVRWNFIPYNPAKRIEPPKAEVQSKTVYTEAQLSQFIHALESQPVKYKAMVFLALTCGLRREEIFGLQWKHFNLEKTTVKIEQAIIYTKRTGIISKETKNQRSNRLLTFPAYILSVLKQHKATQLSLRLKLGDKWDGAEEAEDDYVFTQWNGKPGFPYTMNKWLNKFIADNKLPKITPHIFRHMAATYLITAGHDIRTVSGKLGHSQTSTTMNIYSHLVEKAEQETADTMGNILKHAAEQPKQKKQAK